MKKITSLFILFSFVFLKDVVAQTKEAGPIIKDFGKVWKIDYPDFKVDVNEEYKVVFDIMTSPDSYTEINKTIETAARFLNMHAQSGVPPEKLKVVLVVHNKASKDLITHEAYQKRFETDNPNAALLEALMGAGSQIVFCGQSSLSRDFPKEELIDGVQMALSAMTALVHFQNEGYQLIKF